MCALGFVAITESQSRVEAMATAVRTGEQASMAAEDGEGCFCKENTRGKREIITRVKPSEERAYRRQSAIAKQTPNFVLIFIFIFMVVG